MGNKNHFITWATAAILLIIMENLLNKKKITAKEWESLKQSNSILSPLKGKLKVTSKFGNRIFQGKTQFHNGVDLISVGAVGLIPIYASIDGTVKSTFNNNIGGNQLVIDSGFAQFGYAHLNDHKFPLVKAGDSIKKGQIVGYVGNTGTSTGQHLHFVLRLNGIPVNPVDEIPALKNAI